MRWIARPVSAPTPVTTAMSAPAAKWFVIPNTAPSAEGTSDRNMPPRAQLATSDPATPRNNRREDRGTLIVGRRERSAPGRRCTCSGTTNSASTRSTRSAPNSR
jgi:hypothetical protein